MSLTVEEAVSQLDSKMVQYKQGFVDRTEDLEQKIKNLEAKGGRASFGGGSIENKGLRNLISNQIYRALHERKDQIAESESGALMKPYDIKTAAAISSANLSDNYLSYLDWRPGMEPTGQFHFRNLVRTMMSQTDFVQFPRANTPLGEGSFGRQVEAATKAQI